MGLYYLVQLVTYFYFTFMYIAIAPGFDNNLFIGYTCYEIYKVFNLLNKSNTRYLTLLRIYAYVL